ncbi:MAG: hypothetical protein O2800_07485 [Planctomycetota bacterium]|nr:hypothetical protein [Planctomycetota bacterium]
MGLWQWLIGDAPASSADLVRRTDAGVVEHADAPLAVIPTPVAPVIHIDARDDQVLQPLIESMRTASESQLRLAELADGLRESLASVPDLARHQARATEAILQLATQARERDAQTERMLSELDQGAERQTQVLRLIQQQLDLNQMTNTSVAEGLRDASNALGAYAGTSERHTRAIEALLDSTRRRTRQADRMERTLQTWLAVTTALSTACLAYSLYLAYRTNDSAVSAKTVTTAQEIVATDLDAQPSTEQTVSPKSDGATPQSAQETIPVPVKTELPSEEGRDKPPAVVPSVPEVAATASVAPTPLP